MKKLVIIISHPIQYYAPVFQLLAQKCELKVFYTLGFDAENGLYDKGFKQIIKWDINLLDGYQYEFLNNVAKKPGSHHFQGIKNPEITQRISDFNPAAILVYGWAYQSHLKVLRYFKGKIPLWFRGDSHLLDPKPLWQKLIRKALLTRVYHYIDKVFYVGMANKAYFKSFGLKEHQLIFAPHAVDNERFSGDKSEETNHLRKKLGIDDQKTLILFAGKLEKKKNPELLLQAFAELKMDNVHLLFVGNGELEASLRLKVKSLSFNSSFLSDQDENTQGEIRYKKKSSPKGRIHFLDFQNQSYMPVVYQACDLFCLPSQGPNETWGLAVNEAMAAGKAILVSDKVGCNQNLIHESNGYIFKSNDIFSLKQGLIKVLSKNFNAMGQSSKHIISEWNFKNQVSVILTSLYEE